jgi:hypothetical protein
VFITSKLDNGFHRLDAARHAIDRTLTELGFGYVGRRTTRAITGMRRPWSSPARIS